MKIFGFVLTLCFLSQGWSKELTWVGCGITKKAFMKELASTYKKETGTKIKIKGGGATKGIRVVSKGGADLGGSCRHTLEIPQEKNARMHHVAWDALVVVVKKDNPVDEISSTKLKQVLSGEIKNWKDLGGPDLPLKLYARRGSISGVGLMARELIFGDPKQGFSKDAQLKRSSGPLELAIGKDLAGIGLSGVSSAKRRKRLKILKVDGVVPNKANIASGAYPLFRPLYLVTYQAPKGEVKRFLDFALGQKAQALISALGTVNLVEGQQLKDKFLQKHKNRYFDLNLGK